MATDPDVAPEHHHRRFDAKARKLWLDRGSTIRKQTGIPWIVLHHIPAKTGSGVSGEESGAAEVLAAYKPDYLYPVMTTRFLTHQAKAGTKNRGR